MMTVSINAALALLRAQEKPNILAAAREFGVDRSALSNRFNGKRISKAKAQENRRLLNNR